MRADEQEEEVDRRRREGERERYEVVSAGEVLADCEILSALTTNRMRGGRRYVNEALNEAPSTTPTADGFGLTPTR